MTFIETQRFPDSLDDASRTRWLAIAERCVIRKNGCLYYLPPTTFFLFMPDLLELHFIQLDKFAFNVQNRTYGYDRRLVSIHDFVWVYDLQPTTAALSSPADYLNRARIQRISAADPDAAFFFRAHRFAFVTPPVWSENRFGFASSISKRPGYVNNSLIASEDSPEAVTVSSSIARFKTREIQDGDLLRVNTRISSSCAVRFSEPAVSVEARNTLCQAVKMFLPANPDDAMQPIDVAKLLPVDEEWIADRLGAFDNYVINQRRSARLMGQLFNAAASVLATYSSREDDLSTHRVTATIPNLDSYPLRLRFQLSDMNSEAGWTKHRHVGVWVPGTTTSLLLKTEAVEQDWAGRSLNVTLQTFPWNGGSLARAVSTQGTVNEHDRTASILVCVRLEKASASTIPAYEAVSQMDLLDNVPPTSAGREILDAVYGATPLTTAQKAEGEIAIPPLFVVDEAPLSVRGRLVTMTEDQRKALALGNANFPVVGIQAAFGTDKTVVGACIAAQQARMGWRVIVTATTNAAVAQIAETILAVDEYADLRVCRYIAEAIAFDESVPSTAADMHQLLKSLSERLRTVLEQEALEIYERFREGRLRLEDHARNRSPDDHLTSQEREELLLAERDVSDLIDKVINIMFRHLPPQIVAITTSSLLNTTSSQGIFKNYFNDFDIILCDEASQVPEPVFAAILSRLPNLRHVYVGDLHQLEPYALCSRHLGPVRFGARSIMEVLTKARAVPMAPLITTFRAHPLLNTLPNSFVYDGELQSGTPAEERRLLLDVMRFPCPDLPFIFFDVSGSSQRALSRSHFNDAEADLCIRLVEHLRMAGIAADSICVITFYKEQHRRLETSMREKGVDLSTVDSVQGREKDVVILLTENRRVAGNRGVPR